MALTGEQLRRWVREREAANLAEERRRRAQEETSWRFYMIAWASGMCVVLLVVMLVAVQVKKWRQAACEQQGKQVIRVHGGKGWVCIHK